MYNMLNEHDIQCLKNITSPERVFIINEINNDDHHISFDNNKYFSDILIEIMTVTELSNIILYAYQNNIPVIAQDFNIRDEGIIKPDYPRIKVSLQGKINKGRSNRP